MSIKTGCEYVGYIDPWTDEERLSDEEVVRCRDCKDYRERDATCHSWQWHNWDASIEVAPDGFCAWGERKESK